MRLTAGLGFRLAAGFPSARRAGDFARRTAAISKPECSPRRGVRRDEGIPPYGCPGSRSPSGLPRSPKFIRRGGIYPARGRLPHRRVPGRTMCAPTRGARRRGGSRFAAGFASPRRAGVHARRTAAIPKPECSPRRGVRRDEGIPPYERPGGCGHPVWPVIFRGL